MLALATGNGAVGRTGRSAGRASRMHVMARSLIHRRLSDVGSRLRTAREKLAVVDEQLRAFTDTADDTRLRSLVSETPLADREHRDAQRHADAMTRHRVELVEQIAKLERQQDELLDRLTSETR
jgi:hypothetical protein